jgi:hypothetical protein
MIMDIEEAIMDNEMFEMILVSLDVRKVATTCEDGEKSFETRLLLQTHMKTENKGKVMKEGIPDMPSLIKAMIEQSLNIGKAVQKLIKHTTEGKSTQITRAKSPPIWVVQSFDIYRKKWNCGITATRIHLFQSTWT